MDLTQAQALWSALIGAVLPLLIAVFQQPRWSAPVRAGVMLVVCIAVGLGQAYFSGEIGNAKDTVSMILIVAVSAMTVYRNWWRPSGVTDAIERATLPGGAP